MHHSGFATSWEIPRRLCQAKMTQEGALGKTPAIFLPSSKPCTILHTQTHTESQSLTKAVIHTATSRAQASLCVCLGVSLTLLCRESDSSSHLQPLLPLLGTHLHQPSAHPHLAHLSKLPSNASQPESLLPLHPTLSLLLSVFHELPHGHPCRAEGAWTPESFSLSPRCGTCPSCDRGQVTALNLSLPASSSGMITEPTSWVVSVLF